MTGYERIKLTLEHKEADRAPLLLAWPWSETITRWKNEGMPADADPSEFFGLDDIIAGINPYGCGFPKAIKNETLEDTATHLTIRDGYGRVCQLVKAPDAPMHVLDYTIKTHDDWKKYKDTLNEDLAEGFDVKLREYRAKGRFVTLTPYDHYWWSYCVLGVENLCIKMATDPDMIHDMYQTYTAWSMKMLAKVTKHDVPFDALMFFADMAYKSGPLFSPAYYEEFLDPYYRCFRKWCNDHHVYMLLHSDGNMTKLIPYLIKTGFDVLNPCECRAGMDLHDLKPRWGKELTFWGNINADIIAKGDKKQIEQEVRVKLAAGKPGGGYLFGIDHSTPPTVSVEVNKFMFACARKYANY